LEQNNDIDVIKQLDYFIQETYKIEAEFKSLKQSYDKLEATVKYLIDFSPNPLWIFNEDGHIFAQNEQARELNELLDHIDSSSANQEIVVNDRSYLIKINQVDDKILLSATDLTDQKRQERLVTMGQMAAHLSHEIRNPIGSISLLASTLVKRVIPKNLPLVMEIKKSVYRIERIVKATLMFSKGMQVHKDNFLLEDLQNEIEEAIEYYSYSKDIEVEFNWPQSSIYADFDLLSMLFSNLVFNAIDAIEEYEDNNDEGLIELFYEEDENNILFKIYDSGLDIENKEKLFEAFNSTKLKGNGLGLVLSKQIVEAHDGKIFLLNEEKKGFGVLLPKNFDKN